MLPLSTITKYHITLLKSCTTHPIRLQRSSWHMGNMGLSGTSPSAAQGEMVLGKTDDVRSVLGVLFHVASVGGRTVHPTGWLFSTSSNQSPSAAPSRSNQSPAAAVAPSNQSSGVWARIESWVVQSARRTTTSHRVYRMDGCW